MAKFCSLFGIEKRIKTHSQLNPLLVYLSQPNTHSLACMSFKHKSPSRLRRDQYRLSVYNCCKQILEIEEKDEELMVQQDQISNINYSWSICRRVSRRVYRQVSLKTVFFTHFSHFLNSQPTQSLLKARSYLYWEVQSLQKIYIKVTQFSNSF